MNTWHKVGIAFVSIPVAWLIIVKVVDVSRTPDEIRALRDETKGGFKQVNSRLDYFIGHTVTNDGVAVGRN